LLLVNPDSQPPTSSPPWHTTKASIQTGYLRTLSLSRYVTNFYTLFNMSCSHNARRRKQCPAKLPHNALREHLQPAPTTTNLLQPFLLSETTTIDIAEDVAGATTADHPLARTTILDTMAEEDQALDTTQDPTTDMMIDMEWDRLHQQTMATALHLQDINTADPQSHNNKGLQLRLPHHATPMIARRFGDCLELWTKIVR
jgi:hypothetical protein